MRGCKSIVEICFPVRWKYIYRFGEAVVINETGVHGKHAHQQDNVSSTKEDIPNLEGITTGTVIVSKKQLNKNKFVCTVIS